MPPQSGPWITIGVSIEASNERLLEGLDVWLRLGLISDAEVKRLCRQHLCCTMPILTAEHTTEATPAPPSRLSPTPVSRTAQMLQSLMAEFSLMWLLFLGVFMVVVSSGILAVSQWRQFPPTGQYLILFGYTLAFWVASAWTGQRENLRLTARMLKTATLLIIPVNFWMIDQLKLWQNTVELAIALFAALVLTAIIIRLLQLANAHRKQLTLVTSVGLSWLHWGWGWAGFPIAATYIGTVGTALSVFYQHQGNKTPASQTASREFSLGTIAIAFATLLLLARAIFVARVPISQLGLALGVCGWLFCWLSRQNPNLESRGMSNQPLVISGVVLLLAGWYVSVTAQTPWQAVAVSSLGLWLLVSRLRRRWQAQDLTAIFLVGLQLFWLLWRLIPIQFRQHLIAICTQFAGTTFMPWALVGVALFPYVVLTLLLAARLRKWQQPALANHAELLALLLGIVLTSFSLANPLVRSLNLLMSSLTLAVVTQKRAQAALVYFTHTTGLVAIASGIDLILPNLGIRAWTGILLGVMVAEWCFSVGSHWQLWRSSAWHIGLGLAAISYSLLLMEATDTTDAGVWSLIGLVIPVTLTAIASHPRSRRYSAWLSVLALFFIQILTFSSGAARLTSLGVATILMLLNTRQSQHVLQAVLTVGFGLAFAAAAIWQVFYQHLSVDLFINILALTSLVLWLLRQKLSKRNTTGSIIYTQATDGWAISIAGLNLLILTVYNSSLYVTLAQASGKLLLAATLLTTAVGYRTFAPSNLGFYGISWSLEILVAGIATRTEQPLVNLAIANLILGLTSQLAGDWWIRRGHSYRSWHIIPLIYAALGFLLQHQSFTAFSGLFTLAAALIGIGVGRRRQSFKFLTYFSLLGVSVAAYELLYQPLQQSSSITAQLVLLAGLGTVIALIELWLARWLVPYLRLTRGELLVIAHLHWIGSSGIAGLALLRSPTFGGVLVTAVLGIYALFQGRSTQRQFNSSLEAWTYAGIIEVAGAVSFLIDLVYPDSEWLIAWSAAIACVFAYGMYTLPWNAWGWSNVPWRHSAYVLPGLFVCLSIGQIAIQSLLIVAAFYAWIAKGSGKVRLSYVSIVLADWAIVRLFNIYRLSEPLWYATLLGGALLYIVQVEPGLQAANDKEKRHFLRCLATGLICLTALYQSEANLLLGLLNVGFSIGFIVVGLALRIRAFLFVGTVTFILQVLRQIWFFINDYSFLLWAMGIILGIAFIWIAANFESRREQMVSMLRGWVTELEDWD